MTTSERSHESGSRWKHNIKRQSLSVEVVESAAIGRRDLESILVGGVVVTEHPLDATSVVALQRLRGNAFVQRLVAGPTSRRVASISVRANVEGTLVTAATDRGVLTPAVQRRVPGAGPSVRQAPRLPRGRWGQLPGQRLPPRSTARRDAARREQFERREQQRIDGARRHFEEIVRRAQEFNERWAREGSEPKTAAQRAFHIFVKFLEYFDEVNSHWDKTHSAFETLRLERDAYVKRLSNDDWPTLKKDQKDEAVQRLRAIFRDVKLIDLDLSMFDKELVEAAVPWGIKLEELEAEVRRVATPTMANMGELYEALKKLSYHFNAFDAKRRELISRMSLIRAKINRAIRRIEPIPIVSIPTPGRTIPDNARP